VRCRIAQQRQDRPLGVGHGIHRLSKASASPNALFARAHVAGARIA
jgi:hypothetical protein